MDAVEIKSVSFRRVYILAVIIFVVDAYFWGQGFLAAVTIFSSGFVFLPIYIYKQIKYSGYSRHITKYLIYIISGVLVFTSYYVNNKLAIHRAESLVINLEQYKTEIGSYPEELQDLVPKYYSYVPSAKISAWGDFYYHSEKGKEPMLFYIIYPPFYRNGYDFQLKVWRAFD